MALEFVGGWAGGAAGVLAGYPLDTVKVRIQTSPPGSFRGTFDCLARVARQEGVAGLYRGISSPLLGVAGINAVTFGVNAQVLKRLSNPDSLSSITLAGASAGLVQTSIVSPMELIKTQMQVCGQTEISGTVSHIYRAAGLPGIFRGLGVTATREVPAFAVYFSSYELMMERMGESTPAVLMAGGMAGVFSWITTYPQDVIKSRLQADSFGTNQLYKGPLHCLKVSLQEEGSSFLFRGIGSTVIRAFPMNAVTFGVFSFIMNKWGLKAEDQEYDTVENLQKQITASACELSKKLPWGEKEEELKKLSTLATDGPNILTIQEPLVSSISYTRMYPEQMLWACTETPRREEPQTAWRKMVEQDHTFSTYTYCNFNQFTQRNLSDAYQNLPDVVPPRDVSPPPSRRQVDTPMDVWEEEEPKIPSLLSTAQTCPKTISTQDFLIPTNLLSSRKSPDRIYGFYYLVT